MKLKDDFRIDFPIKLRGGWTSKGKLSANDTLSNWRFQKIVESPEGKVLLDVKSIDIGASNTFAIKLKDQEVAESLKQQLLSHVGKTLEEIANSEADF